MASIVLSADRYETLILARVPSGTRSDRTPEQIAGHLESADEDGWPAGQAVSRVLARLAGGYLPSQIRGTP